MTFSSALSSMAATVGVRLYDRPPAPSDRDAEPSALLLDRLRVWCDMRELLIVEEHVADGPYDDQALIDVAAACRADRLPLIVWDVALVVGGHVQVLRLLEALEEAPLIHAQADRRLSAVPGRRVVAVPTPWQPVRWAPRRARAVGAS